MTTSSPQLNQGNDYSAISLTTHRLLFEPKERTDIPLSARRFIMFTFLSSIFFINFSGGFIPAALLSIQKDLRITWEEVAILYSVTPFFCGVLTVFLAPLMILFEARTVLTFCQFFNFFGTAVFMGTENYWALCAGRALNGFT